MFANVFWHNIGVGIQRLPYESYTVAFTDEVFCSLWCQTVQVTVRSSLNPIRARCWLILQWIFMSLNRANVWLGHDLRSIWHVSNIVRCSTFVIAFFLAIFRSYERIRNVAKTSFSWIEVCHYSATFWIRSCKHILFILNCLPKKFRLLNKLGTLSWLND